MHASHLKIVLGDDPDQAERMLSAMARARAQGQSVTGDVYRLDEEGYFWFVARADDMIISSGYNIGAPEVENALLRHPAVAEAAVIGVPDEERGQIVKAFVVLSPGHSASDALRCELQDHVKGVIAPYKYPRALDFVDALPRTAYGKVVKGELRQGYHIRP